MLALFCLCLLGCPDEVPAPPPPPPTEPVDPRPERPATPEEILRHIVKTRCLDPAQPWALAHGILVKGKELRLPDGSLAVDRLVADNLTRIEGRAGFPRGARGRPIEPHPGLFTKTLIEVGVAKAYRFALPGGKAITLAELIDDQAQGYTPGSKLPFHNEAWMLEVLAASNRPEAELLALESLATLAENQAYLEVYLRDPKKTYTKPFVKANGQPRAAEIHRYYCGGLHLFQAVQRLHGTQAPPKLLEQYRFLILRLEKETSYWNGHLERALAGRKERRLNGPKDAEHVQVILGQKLKLQGHALETYLRAARSGAVSPSAKESRAIEAGFLALGKTIEAIQREGIYDRLDSIQMTQPQLYLDWVGDSAHALHAYILHKSPK